jgi:hypothetical protein
MVFLGNVCVDTLRKGDDDGDVIIIIIIIIIPKHTEDQCVNVKSQKAISQI